MRTGLDVIGRVSDGVVVVVMSVPTPVGAGRLAGAPSFPDLEAPAAAIAAIT